MAHKKAGGSTRNGRDSESKRLGVKRFGGETVVALSGNRYERWLLDRNLAQRAALVMEYRQGALRRA